MVVNANINCTWGQMTVVGNFIIGEQAFWHREMLLGGCPPDMYYEASASLQAVKVLPHKCSLCALQQFSSGPAVDSLLSHRWEYGGGGKRKSRSN